MIIKPSALILLAAALPVSAETAPDVLARMDGEAPTFHQITAKLKKTEFTEVLNDTTVETGNMWLRRTKGGLVMRTEFTTPKNQRSVGVEGNKAEIYYPNINTVQIYNLGKFGSLVDQFLVLGFGSSGKDIEKNYTVTFGGEETVGGQKTSQLELIPRSEKVRGQFDRIELWIPLKAGHPVQQRLNQPNGNYYLFTYTDIKLNPGLPAADFRLKLPDGAKKEYPQK
jgi:outer membrane lipoprotein-sorting protein